MGALNISTRGRPRKRQLETVAQGRHYLTFSVANEVFAIPISSIKKSSNTARRPTPMMPSYIRGVINLRGRVVPVIDLAVRFGRSQEGKYRSAPAS